MTKQEAAIEVFWTAIKDLPATGRQSLIRHMVEDRRFRRDLIDIAIIESRRREPSRPFKAYLGEQKNRS